MTKIIIKIRRGIKRGSALLIAILVMGLLMTLALGISTLVIREISSTGDIVAAGKAYFAAEAGVENALLDLKEHLPGYETEIDLIVSLEGGKELHYKYEIRNQGDTYPYFDEDEPIFLAPGVAASKEFVYGDHGLREVTYNTLPLNETVTIPLFTEDEDGNVRDVEDFLLEYYVGFAGNLNPQFQNVDLEDLDILRWKIFGVPEGDQVDVLGTEAISDFFPVHSQSTADTPTCIGTGQDLDDTGVSCWFPVLDLAGGASSPNLWSAARECYVSDAGDIVTGGGSPIKTGETGGCSIQTFILNHTRNYLTLTNLVNPDIIGTDPETRAQKANIYYRIIAKNTDPDEPKLVREFAHISADGFASGDRVKQSIDVKLGLKQFLPVFNFSLYRTDTTDDTYGPVEEEVSLFSKFPWDLLEIN